MASDSRKWSLPLIVVALLALGSFASAAPPAPTGMDARVERLERDLLVAQTELDAFAARAEAFDGRLVDGASAAGALSARVGAVEAKVAELAAPTPAAERLFLKLEDIDGESKDDGHGKEIDILSFSWGATATLVRSGDGGRGTGRVNVQDITFTKWVDAASPKLFLACATGKHIPEATLTVARGSGDGRHEYLIITMQDVLVSSYSTGASASGDATETLSMNFAKLSMRVVPQQADGSPGVPVVGDWDAFAP